MQENEIQAIVAGQRQFFFSGKTLPLDYRIQALKRLKQAIVGNQKKIADALQQDLGKSEAEGFMVAKPVWCSAKSAICCGISAGLPGRKRCIRRFRSSPRAAVSGRHLTALR